LAYICHICPPILADDQNFLHGKKNAANAVYFDQDAFHFNMLLVASQADSAAAANNSSRPVLVFQKSGPTTHTTISKAMEKPPTHLSARI
jgi:hypothetical protein